MLSSSCVWWAKTISDTPWTWCFDFKHKRVQQQPFCGYDKRDCKQTRERMLNARKYNYLEVTSECYFNEDKL